MPIKPRWMLESQVQVSSLQAGIGYQTTGYAYRSAGSSGVPLTGMIQAGLGIRRLELVQLGLQWTLEAAMHTSYARAAPAIVSQTGQLGSAGSGQPWASWEQQQKRQGTIILGAEAAVRYEFAERQYLLISLNYHHGLSPLAEIRSTQVSYVDAGQFRTDGRFVVPVRISYTSLQFCYGWRLAPALARATRWHTPRYHLALPGADEEDALETLP
ncbi:hypothetical protein [Hymenobacter metallilatus]|uniref:Outer membrane protein beta-barrel domain-containing protein n=1 Tax=Hymenobacter metallilatus TaxID=2493666 RepID=A0A3R9PEH2_9BACT|nr:hypothetical protein [Hymenobacter metallilatus]RSK35389.1 hypothetical protein EI290_06730 [Hymenobacter metallilatus]